MMAPEREQARHPAPRAVEGRAERVVVPGGGVVHVLGTVQGLRDERERVRAALDAVRPGAVAVGTGPEGVRGLRDYGERLVTGNVPGRPRPEAEAERAREPRRHADGTLYEEDLEDPYAYEAEDLLTDGEVVYGLALQRFGDVRLPPRCLLEAVERADAAELPVVGVDYDEDEYADAWTRHVNTWALLRYTRRVRRLEKRPPRADDARAFALAWDAYLTRMKPVAAFEAEREGAIAERAAAVAREHGDVLLVVEVARADGVLRALRDLG